MGWKQGYIGGSQDLISKDKLSFPQIVCKTLYPKEFQQPTMLKHRGL